MCLGCISQASLHLLSISLPLLALDHPRMLSTPTGHSRIGWWIALRNHRAKPCSLLEALRTVFYSKCNGKSIKDVTRWEKNDLSDFKRDALFSPAQWGMNCRGMGPLIVSSQRKCVPVLKEIDILSKKLIQPAQRLDYGNRKGYLNLHNLYCKPVSRASEGGLGI